MVTEGQIPTKIDDFETDNRDEGTTELHFEIDGKLFTIEVNPIDLFKNMVENCFEGREPGDIDEDSRKSLRNMVTYLNEVLYGTGEL